jgi:hypothetical protein
LKSSWHQASCTNNDQRNQGEQHKWLEKAYDEPLQRVSAKIVGGTPMICASHGDSFASRSEI